MLYEFDPRRRQTVPRRDGIAAAIAVNEAGTGLRSVQNGSATLPADTATIDVALPTALLDKNKAFLVFSTNPASSTTRWGHVAGGITNQTTLHFDRQVGAGIVGAPAITIEWYVAEFYTGVTVQHGILQPATWSGSTNQTINAVDLARSFVIFTHSEPGSLLGSDDMLGAQLTSTTNLRFEDNSLGGTVDGPMYWQVIEFTDGTVSVQRGTIAYTSADASKTATITSVDTTKTLLVMSAGNDVPSTGTADHELWRGEITNATTLTFTRGNGATSGGTIYWQAISFSGTTTVQKGTLTFASGDSFKDAAIAAVTLTKAFAIVGGQYGRLGSTTAASADVSGATVTLDFTTTTNLRATRSGVTTTDTIVPWFVVEFTPAAATDVFFENTNAIERGMKAATAAGLGGVLVE